MIGESGGTTVIRMHQFQDPGRGCFLPHPQVVKHTEKGTRIAAPAGWDGSNVIRFPWTRDYLLVDDNLLPVADAEPTIDTRRLAA